MVEYAASDMTQSLTSSPSAEELLALAHDRGTESRARLAEIISGLFSAEKKLCSREIDLIQDILHQVLKSVEIELRRRISESLAVRADIPKSVVCFLSREEIEIAYPILKESHLLADQDLIEIIQHNSYEHQMAITLRNGLGPVVCDALVATGDENLIVSTLRNESASFHQDTLGKLVEDSRNVLAFQKPLGKRPDLPDTLAKRLFLWVSAAIRSDITNRFSLSPDVVDDLLEQAAQEALEATVKEKDNSAVSIMPDELAFSAKELLAALHIGDVRRFVLRLSMWACIRERLINRMLMEPCGEGLAILARALGIGRADFSMIFMMVRAANPAGIMNLNDHHAKAMAFYDSLNENEAAKVLHHWQRDKDYLTALQQVSAHLPT